MGREIEPPSRKRWPLWGADAVRTKLVKFIEHQVADRRVVRLIQTWLKAGVLMGIDQDLRVFFPWISLSVR